MVIIVQKRSKAASEQDTRGFSVGTVQKNLLVTNMYFIWAVTVFCMKVLLLRKTFLSPSQAWLPFFVFIQAPWRSSHLQGKDSAFISHATVEPQYNEVPREWQNLFAIIRFHYKEVLFDVFYYFWDKQFNHFFYWGVRYIEVHYTEAPLYFNILCFSPGLRMEHVAYGSAVMCSTEWASPVMDFTLKLCKNFYYVYLLSV